MSINKENIEEYIFDYLEGNISEVELTEFKNFVEDNPEVKDDLQYWKQSYINSNTTVSSSEFSSLKKSNKAYYWGTGILASFLLGIGTMVIIDNVTHKQILVQPKEDIIIPVKNSDIENEEIEFIEEVEENIDVTTSTIMIDDDVEIEKLSEIENEESINLPKEDIELITQRDIDLKETEVNRKANLETIKIKKKEQSVKKKKAVDVIDIETGF